ncbi:MAG: hypothetical protein WBE18_07850, partial [Gammaproteobacteria bacterium]
MFFQSKPDTVTSPEKNYMQEKVELLKNAICEVISEDWKLTEFEYRSDVSRGSVGIYGKVAKGKSRFNINYPLDEHPTLENFIDALNCDATLLNV